jgi:phage terminase large subunit
MNTSAAAVTINIPYHVRNYFRAFHASPRRFKIVVAHRRAGKTVAAINELVKGVLSCVKPNPRGAYIAPTFSQAKDIAWTYLKEYTRNIPGCKYYESDLRVDFPNGGRIKLYGAENEDRLRGLYFDIVVIDEFASMAAKIWEEVVRPALSDRQGSAMFLGTPKGHDAFYDLWKDAQEHPDEWFSLMLRASETGILPPEELAANLRLMDESTYAREFECDFSAAFEGAYFAKEIQRAYTEKRIGNVPYDSAANVYCSWDLGIADAMALWFFQIVGQEWHFIKYYQNTAQGLDHYIDYVRKMPYNIDLHLLPHDAAARSLETSKTRQMFMQERGLNNIIVPRHKIEDGINAIRLMFNRAYFDEKNCGMGINCLRMYRTAYSEKNRVLSATPLHDWASHGADSFRTGVMGMSEASAKILRNSDWKTPVARKARGTFV